MSSSMMPLEAARAYAKRGWPVFPLHTPAQDGCSCRKPDCANIGKHPRTPHGLKDATTDEATIRRWWTRWPEANIGLVTGPISGLVVIDVDPRHGGELTVEDLEAEHGRFPDTAESLTGGGGRHLLYQHPGEKVTSAASSLGPGVDIKADGGYIVAPPSRHASGRLYEWELSSHPDSVPIAPLPAWFPLHRAIPLDPTLATHVHNGQPGEGSPGEDFNRRATREAVRAILTRHGWMVVEHRDGVDYLRRPGKQGHSHSGTLGAVAPTVFYCFTTSGHPFQAGHGYKPFSVYGLLEHAGDFTAAARTLAHDGYGNRNAQHGSDQGKDRRPSMADRLIRYALSKVEELFVDQFGQGHALVEGQAIPLHRGCYPWLRRLFYEVEERGISGDTLQTAAGTLEAQAMHGKAQYDLHVRSAWHQECLYVELRPGRVVRVDAHGWLTDDDPPVRFRRYANLGVLPDPKPCESLDDLLQLLPLKGEADRRVMRAYICTGLLPHIARPILLFTGPQGAAKSTTHRLIKRVLDPGKPEAIRLDPRDIIQKASHCQVAMFDNLSKLQDWAINILCRLCTGEADSKRKLYTDDDDVIYELRRLVLINGINPPADRGDFHDRIIPIDLERLAEDQRLPEERLWGMVADRHPEWLGAIFTMLSKAMAVRRRLDEEMRTLPRLGDWGLWAGSIYEVNSDEYSVFLRDWREVTTRQHEAVLEGSPVAQALLILMKDREQWSGMASELYDALRPIVEGLHLAKDRSWPRSAKGLGRRLRELQPLLMDHRIKLEKDREPTRDRRKVVTLKKLQ